DRRDGHQCNAHEAHSTHDHPPQPNQWYIHRQQIVRRRVNQAATRVVILVAPAALVLEGEDMFGSVGIPELIILGVLSLFPITIGVVVWMVWTRRKTARR